MNKESLRLSCLAKKAHSGNFKGSGIGETHDYIYYKACTGNGADSPIHRSAPKCGRISWEGHPPSAD